MSREKQIDEMSCDLYDCHIEFVTGVDEIYTDYDAMAEKMFDKGYRKQSDGEWLGRGIAMVCSLCGKGLVVEQGDADMNYCPNCGAKMKGGAE